MGLKCKFVFIDALEIETLMDGVQAIKLIGKYSFAILKLRQYF